MSSVMKRLCVFCFLYQASEPYVELSNVKLFALNDRNLDVLIT